MENNIKSAKGGKMLNVYLRGNHKQWLHKIRGENCSVTIFQADPKTWKLSLRNQSGTKKLKLVFRVGEDGSYTLRFRDHNKFGIGDALKSLPEARDSEILKS